MLFSRFKFLADPKRTANFNACRYLATMPAIRYFSKPTQLAFHNLCNTYSVDCLSKHLLGLGLNFIPKPAYSSGPKDIDVDRFIRDSHTKFMFADDNTSTAPKLFIRSNFTPDPGELNRDFVTRIGNFSEQLPSMFKRTQARPNLMPFQQATLETLQLNDEVMIVKTDKNLGPAILEKPLYIKKALDNHLLDTKTYKQISESEARQGIANIRLLTIDFTMRHKLSKSDRTYLTRWIEQTKDDDGFAYFYLLAKVHKTPWATRPIVSASGSAIYGLSKWVDTELQKVLRFVPYTLKCSTDLVNILSNMHDLPRNFKLFSADASSMYTNINTVHALPMIKEFFDQSPDIISRAAVDPNAILNGLRIVMENNIFKFGDTYWWQISGTAMGTPCAPSYATLYFAIHEMKHVPQITNIKYYVRYLDDILGIWVPNDPFSLFSNEQDSWNAFQAIINTYGDLTWNFTELVDEIDFLDLHIYSDQARKRRLHTRLFEKGLNLYLYLPPNSAHTPGVLRGFVIGMLLRIFRLTTDKDRISEDVNRFYTRLIARGFYPELLKTMFHEVLTRIMIRLQQHTTTRNNTSLSIQDDRQDSKPLLLHLKYHPQDPSSKRIQQLFRDIVSQPANMRALSMIETRHGNACEFNRLIIAFSRHPNLAELLSCRKLNDEFVAVSTMLEQSQIQPP